MEEKSPIRQLFAPWIRSDGVIFGHSVACGQSYRELLSRRGRLSIMITQYELIIVCCLVVGSLVVKRIPFGTRQIHISKTNPLVWCRYGWSTSMIMNNLNPPWTGLFDHIAWHRQILMEMNRDGPELQACCLVRPPRGHCYQFAPSSWRNLSLWKDSKGVEAQVAMIKGIREKIKSELAKICQWEDKANRLPQYMVTGHRSLVTVICFVLCFNPALEHPTPFPSKYLPLFH